MRTLNDKHVEYLVQHNTLKDLRKMQTLIIEQQQKAYRTHNMKALAELNTREDEVSMAIGEMAFGDYNQK